MMGDRFSVGRRARIGALVAGLALVAAACQPGWTSPFVGSGDGSGTTPGATTPADDTSVALSQPTSVVAIPGGGFYVYDNTACAIYKVSNDTSTLYAGTPGKCGDTGDGGPATDAELQSPADADLANVMALGRDGTLYLASGNADGGALLRMIAPDGTISSSAVFTNGELILGVTAAPDGTIYASTSGAFGGDGHGTVVVLNVGGSWNVLYTGTTDTISHLTAISSTEVVLSESAANIDTPSPLERVDLKTGVATATGVTTSDALDFIAADAAPDGTVYLGVPQTSVWGDVSATVNGVSYSGQVLRIDPDNTVTPIAGTGTADPKTHRQWGDGLSLDLSPTGVAVTPHNGLLISSGHVVYRLDHPAKAGATTSTTSSTTTTVAPAG